MHIVNIQVITGPGACIGAPLICDTDHRLCEHSICVKLSGRQHLSHPLLCAALLVSTLTPKSQKAISFQFQITASSLPSNTNGAPFQFKHIQRCQTPLYCSIYRSCHQFVDYRSRKGQRIGVPEALRSWWRYGGRPCAAPHRRCLRASAAARQLPVTCRPPLARPACAWQTWPAMHGQRQSRCCAGDASAPAKNSHEYRVKVMPHLMHKTWGWMEGSDPLQREEQGCLGMTAAMTMPKILMSTPWPLIMHRRKYAHVGVKSRRYGSHDLL